MNLTKSKRLGPPRKNGRPSRYSPEVREQIKTWLAHGHSNAWIIAQAYKMYNVTISGSTLSQVYAGAIWK